MISVSIVSHGHGEMVGKLIKQLLEYEEVKEIFLTKNIFDNSYVPSSKRIFLIENKVQKGFGENHNAAFKFSSQECFCVLNPDIQFLDNPFPALLESLKKNRIDIVAPIVVNDSGCLEDNFRFFPSMLSIFTKLIFGVRLDYAKKIMIGRDFRVDWSAGMFMLFTRSSFDRLCGFDEAFYLYYEDVDICMRARLNDIKIYASVSAKVIHNAQRASHLNLKFFKFHVLSLARYFWRKLFFYPFMSCKS